jgi:hypothetical protein
VPISELYINDLITINPSIQYMNAGKWQITWTTTVAGSYDMAVLVKP